MIARCQDIPVYTGGRELLVTLTGYVLTRGVLCAIRRPAPLPLEEVCRDARRIVVINSVVDTTNIGAIFRSAAALGVDAVLLTRSSCDPLNHRAVRVSMSGLRIPFTAKFRKSEKVKLDVIAFKLLQKYEYVSKFETTNVFLFKIALIL